MSQGRSATVGVDGEWWQEAVFYQIYPRSFVCAQNPHGVGDLRGIISRLDYIESLGVDAIWLSPIFLSPQRDHGYDVADYCEIDPIFGTMADFDELLERAHSRGLRVTIDMVPNHTSDQHHWFQAALAAGPGSPERDRFRFRNGRGVNQELPPTDVVSSFSGPAWTQVVETDGQPGQWYFHLFASEQPDLNWENPEVLAEFERIWAFWLDKGVDGFRVDVADHLTKDIDRTDCAEGNQLLEHEAPSRSHEVWRAFRGLLDGYEPPRMAVGEVWAQGDSASLYCRPDEFPTVFNFPFLKAGWDAAALRDAIDAALLRRGALGAVPTWVMDNHDMARSSTRLSADSTVGLRRSIALTMLMLALPGVAYLYQGQELGLPNVDDLPDAVLQDPIWARSGFTDRGRDGCRVPLPWTGDAAPYGFSASHVDPWLPQPEDWGRLTVAHQMEDSGSTLNRIRNLIAVRRQRRALRAGSLAWLSDETGVLHFERQFGAMRVEVLSNLTSDDLPVPSGQILARSSDSSPERTLSPDTTIWVATSPHDLSEATERE